MTAFVNNTVNSTTISRHIVMFEALYTNTSATENFTFQFEAYFENCKCNMLLHMKRLLRLVFTYLTVLHTTKLVARECILILQFKPNSHFQEIQDFLERALMVIVSIPFRNSTIFFLFEIYLMTFLHLWKLCQKLQDHILLW